MPYPLVPPPANDYGAFPWPRTLQRWLDINPATKLTRTGTFITIPAFQITLNNPDVVSDIKIAFDYVSPNNFSLDDDSLLSIINQITTQLSGNTTAFAIIIAYRVQGLVTRYTLWQDPSGYFSIYYADYTDQVIMKNFRIEIWDSCLPPTPIIPPTTPGLRAAVGNLMQGAAGDQILGAGGD